MRVMFPADRRARCRRSRVFFAKPPYPSARPRGCQCDGSANTTVDGEKTSGGEAQISGQMLEFLRMSRPAIDTFPNPRPERDYEIAISCPEFTSLCPKTGLPDFGEIRITYTPDALCLELKALKYYMIGFRNRGIFYEHVTNQILDDLVSAIHPRRMTVVGDFSVRGGIKTVVTAAYDAKSA
jgi:7-cyano-7-deazaguanine reductase